MKKLLPFFTALIGTPLFALLFSSVFIHLGDNAVLMDHLQNAQTLYSFAQLFNPFNPDTDRRVLAVNVNLYERTHETEETASPNQNVAQVITPQNVLGVTSCVPVLMYHYIRVNPWPTDLVGYGLSTPPIAFAQQLDYYLSKGYQTITLADLKNHIELYKAMEIKKKNPSYKLPRAVLLPKKPLIITLDDGYEDSYTQALPLLKARGMKAVDFVITGFVGLPNYLTWNQIGVMEDSGVFEIESHTVHHYALASANWNSALIQYEMTQSKNDLENHLGKPIDWFAYPYGSVNDNVAKEAEKLYFGAFGTNFGAYQSTEEQYTLPRIRVSGGDWGPSVDARIQQAMLDAKCVQ